MILDEMPPELNFMTGGGSPYDIKKKDSFVDCYEQVLFSINIIQMYYGSIILFGILDTFKEQLMS